MRSLRLEAGAGPRLDPLLMQITASVAGRSRDQGEREPPSTRQELDLVMVMVLVLPPCTVAGRTRYCAS